MTTPDLTRLTKLQKLELISLLEEKARRAKMYAYRTFLKSRYDWQKKFLFASATHRFSALIAANR